jgi:histone deacetylase 1/2
VNPPAKEGDPDSFVANPQYQSWHQQDQSILSAIICSITEGALGMVMNVTTSREAWEALEGSFASQSTARVMHIRGALSKVKKLDMSATAFFNKVKSMSDILTSIGQPLRPEEFTAYLLAGLDSEYDPLVDRVSARAATDPMPIRDVFAQILNTEQRIEARHAEVSADVHTANYNARSGTGGGRQPDYRADTRLQHKPAYNNSKPVFFNPSPDQRGSSTQQRGPSTGGSGTRPICQICTKTGHVASCCFKRYQRNYLGAGNDGRNMERQLAALSATHGGSTSSYPVDPHWYADTAATDHFTNDLDKLTMKEPYRGKDQVQAANRSGMRITHIGQSILSTPSHPLHLKNILHVPSITRNLLSVKKFAHDNNVFFEFHPWYFLVKDRASRAVLLRGGCRGGLYNLDVSSIKQVFSSVKVSREQWHSRLGHPATQIVQHVLHRHELPSVSVNKAVICDACQQGKSHQLPFSLSTRVTTSPLEIIY